MYYIQVIPMFNTCPIRKSFDVYETAQPAQNQITYGVWKLILRTWKWLGMTVFRVNTDFSGPMSGT
jgi:hypothetical protein